MLHQQFFYIIVLVACLFGITESANHYCINRQILSLNMDDYYHRDETIIPIVMDEPTDKILQPKFCRWDIRLKTANPKLQFVIEGIEDRKINPKNIANHSINQTNAPMLINSKTEVSSGKFDVQPINKNQYLSVQARWNPRTQSMQPQKLRIVIPLPNICNRDMLSFNGSCYAVNSAKQNIADALKSVRGNAELASFRSMAEIEEFVAANDAKLSKFPYRRPLSLSQPVRLGMFISASNASVLSIVRSNNGCRLKAVQNSEEFKLATPDVESLFCVSLKVAPQSGKAIVELTDCNKKMLSLLSFPETAKSIAPSAACNTSKLAGQFNQLKSQQIFTSTFENRTVAKTDRRKTHDSSMRSESNVKIFVYFIISGVVGILVLLYALVVTIKRSNFSVNIFRSNDPKRILQPRQSLQSEIESHVENGSDSLLLKDSGGSLRVISA